MSSRSTFWPALVGAATLLAAPLAFAQGEPGKPCQADAKKLCPGVKPDGHGALLACLEGKADQVSAACKDEVKAKVEAMANACKSDIEKFCAGVEKGQGRILQCLKTNASGLSDSCKAFWSKAKAKAAKAGAN
jgi:hypothetical protein